MMILLDENKTHYRMQSLVIEGDISDFGNMTNI